MGKGVCAIHLSSFYVRYSLSKSIMNYSLFRIDACLSLLRHRSLATRPNSVGASANVASNCLMSRFVAYISCDAPAVNLRTKLLARQVLLHECKGYISDGP